MTRILLALLFALTLLASGCKKEKEPEPEGLLPGHWYVKTIYPELCDANDKVLFRFAPTISALNIRQLIFTDSTVTQLWQNGTRVEFPYVRSGNQIICPKQTFSESFTILKLTSKELHLYLRGEFPEDPTVARERYGYKIEMARN